MKQTAIYAGRLLCALLVAAAWCAPAAAQTKEDGLRLLKEADALSEKPQHRDDLTAALRKYEQAVEIFEKIGFRKGVSVTTCAVADLHKKLGDHERAIEWYEKSLRIDRELNDQNGEGVSLNKIAEAYEERGQYEKALEFYEKAKEIFEKIGFRKGVAVATLNIGNVCEERGDHERAIEWYEKSLRIKRELNDRKGEGVTLNQIAGVYDELGQYEKALDFYEKSLSIAIEVKDRRMEGQALNNAAAVRKSLGRYDGAVEYYERAREIFREVGDRNGEAHTLTNLGDLWRVRGRGDKALELHDKALALYTEMGNAKGRANVLNNIALVHEERGAYQEAMQRYEETLALMTELGDQRGRSMCLNNMADIRRIQGDYDRALKLYEESLAVDRALNRKRGVADVLINIGVVYDEMSQYDKAERLFNEALEICREMKAPRCEAVALGNLAGVHTHRGEYVRALELSEESLAIKRNIGDRAGEAASLQDMGIVFAKEGKFQKELESYEAALSIARELEARLNQCKLVTNMGAVYARWGRYEKALELFGEALRGAKELGAPASEAAATHNIATIYRSIGDYTRSLALQETALALQRRLSNRNDEAVSLNNIGSLYEEMGDLDKAEKAYRESVSLFKRLGVPATGPSINLAYLFLDQGDPSRAEPLVKEAGEPSPLGRLALIRGDYREATVQYEKRLDMARENRDSDGLFIAWTGLGAAAEGQGNFDKAAEHYRKAVDHLENLRSSLSPGNRERFFEYRAGGFPRREPYDGLARCLIRLNRPEEAFRESEALKARVFAEAVSRRGLKTDGHASQEAQEEDERINDELGALSKALQEAYEKNRAQAVAVLEPRVRELKSKKALHVETLRKKFPLFAATRYSQPMGLEETSLRDDERVLAYHVTDSGILIYLSEGKTLKKGLFKAVERAKLNALVRRFRAPFDEVNEDNAIEKLEAFDFVAGKELADLLLTEALEVFPKEAALIIVPDGPLGALPFETLVLNQAGLVQTRKGVPCVTGAEFFGDRNPISYAQSVTALTLARTLARTEEAAPKRMLAIADPVFEMKDRRAEGLKETEDKRLGSVKADILRNLMAAVEKGEARGLRFDRLPLTGVLAKRLSESHRGGVDVFTGLDANKETFLSNIAPNLDQYGDIVFATHGYFGNDLPGIMEPVLALTAVPAGIDGFLRMSEVMALRMSAETAALTACRTGLGKTLSGEGAMGMGRAFQYAGAKSVLMSLWSVAQDSSVKLVENFYRYTKEGKGKLEALRRARKDVRDAGYDHPFFWAAFVLMGET
jgi:tetratricopeptide (TPR) repeat protein